MGILEGADARALRSLPLVQVSCYKWFINFKNFNSTDLDLTETFEDEGEKEDQDERKLNQGAINADVLSADPTGGVTCEEDDDVGDFVGLTEAVEGRLFGEEIHLLPGFAGHEKFGFDRAGRDGVHGDAARGNFFGERAGDLLHGAFSPAISAVAGYWPASGGTGKVDDAPALGEARGCLLAGEEGAFDVDGENAIELRFGNIADGFVEHDSSIVHKDVQLAKLLYSLVEQTDDFRDASHVGLNRDCVTAGGFDIGDELFGFLSAVGIVDGDGSAGFGESFGDGAADAAGGAGDEGDFSFEVMGHSDGVSLRNEGCQAMRHLLNCHAIAWCDNTICLYELETRFGSRILAACPNIPAHENIVYRWHR